MAHQARTQDFRGESNLEEASNQSKGACRQQAPQAYKEFFTPTEGSHRVTKGLLTQQRDNEASK